MNDLKKSQDNQNREELKVLARYHSNKDELQRFDSVTSLYSRLCLYTTVCLSICLSVILGLILCPVFCLSVCLPHLSHFCWCSSSPFIFLIQIDVVVFGALFIYLCLCPSFTFQEKTWGEQKAHRTIRERETEGLLVLYCVVYWMWEGIAQM